MGDSTLAKLGEIKLLQIQVKAQPWWSPVSISIHCVTSIYTSGVCYLRMHMTLCVSFCFNAVDSLFSNYLLRIFHCVTEPPTPVLRLQTAWTDVFEKEAMEFRCEVSSRSHGWTFTWFRDTQPIQSDTVQRVTEGGSSLRITSVSQTHGGKYTCKAHLTPRSVSSGFSNELTVKVNGEFSSTQKLNSG